MNRNLPTVILSDLDSTLCYTEHRHGMAPEDHINGDWGPYLSKCMDDDLITGTLVLLRLLYPYHMIHFVSGRSESARENTEWWLDFYQVPYDVLILYDEAKWSEKPSNGDLKVRYIREMKSKGYTVVLFLEDWEETAKSIEAEGVPVLRVNPGYKNPTLTYL